MTVWQHLLEVLSAHYQGLTYVFSLMVMAFTLPNMLAKMFTDSLYGFAVESKEDITLVMLLVILCKVI